VTGGLLAIVVDPDLDLQQGPVGLFPTYWQNMFNNLIKKCLARISGRIRN
jgi:hypothetical protein